MQSVMITGCNRGIGLSLVKQFLSGSSTPKNVIATCRNLKNAPELAEIMKIHSKLKVFEIDLKEFNKFDNLVKNVETITQGNGLNLLINNAGISTKFTRIPLLKLEQLIENFVINTAAPLMLTKSCLPLLKKASVSNSSLPIGVNRAAIVNISSILGSISQNTEGGFYPYRCSKTALNAATKSLSCDLKNDGILVVAIHPGWLKTDMGGPNAPLEVDFATATLIKTINGLTAKQNGSFIQFDGKVLPY